jgi:dynein heavy chain
LNKVLPLLSNATEALDKITKEDMINLKSFTNPPLSAAVVMEGLCYAF